MQPQGMLLQLVRSRAVQLEVERLSLAPIDALGSIYTRSGIVHFMLDLSGYVSTADLAKLRILEPSFGEGGFLFEIVNRLIKSYLLFDGLLEDVKLLEDCIRAVEIHRVTYEKTKKKLSQLLIDYGVTIPDAQSLVEKWLICDDFLLVDFKGTFTHVVGNPPYVRIESLSDLLVGEYRERFSTMKNRADLYIPFFEKGLTLLAPEGLLSFICSDRWVKNTYGAGLRNLIQRDFFIKYYIDATGYPCFEQDVSVYPSIVVITRKRSLQGTRRVQLTTTSNLKNISKNFESQNLGAADTSAQPIGHSYDQHDIILSSPLVSEILKVLAAFPKIEEVGCKIGIGVATGRDDIYINKLSDLPVENEAKIPLLMREDIQSGKVRSNGWGLVNPFCSDGTLRVLNDWPQLKTFFELHEQTLKKRYVAKKNPKSWYRTIDKIDSELLKKPKLLIPDISNYINVVYDKGEFYPHHNLYYITSNEWDLKALATILRSSLIQFLIRNFSTTVRGGYFRCQAQFLRKLPLVPWGPLSQKLKADLA
ncbi:MAG: TaqI-like C-terminal specificity domain-containing protein, partial [Patescibacteria group bacterium]